MSSQYKPRTKHLNELLMSKKSASGYHGSKKDYNRSSVNGDTRMQVKCTGYSK